MLPLECQGATVNSQGVSLKLSLLDNGIDFIKTGIETFFSKDEPGTHEHKYALMHIYSGVLLVLKERLKRAHPSLVFKDVETVGTPNAKTVDFTELLGRLCKCAGVKLSSEGEETLRRVQRMRNTIEHYEVDLNLKHVEKMIGDLAEFTFAFMRDHLDTQLEAHLDDLSWERVQELRAISTRIKEEEAERWRKKTAKYRRLSAKKLEDLRDAYEGDPRDGDRQELIECPGCWEESVAVMDSEVGVCTNRECRQICRLNSCMSCGNSTTSREFCPNCKADIERVTDGN
ncbi:hypothetical protein JYJ95_06740 [Corallococcus exiguus]|uniref:hypothetical protein n=1 Tax=Corallococcus exiguus TaxID=83462 RepID=UPI001A8D8DB7|nr:hypothetical protein [Corallococcus exiguus]MBN8466202.1 hypothetical protein [Corallococcus exiguus]